MKDERSTHPAIVLRSANSSGKFFVDEEKIYKLPHRSALLISLIAPSLVVVISLALAWLPTRDFGLWLLEENNPVETLTFLAAFAGSAYALRLAPLVGRQRKAAAAFYFFWSVAFFLLAMEEIAWGQHLLGFEPPSFISDINEQEELTLHNLRGINGTSEFAQFILGAASLAWLAYGWSKQPSPFTAPRLLLPLSVCIALLAGGDLWQRIWDNIGFDFSESTRRLAFYFNNMDELNELLIAIFGFLLVWLNARLDASRARLQRAA